MAEEEVDELVERGGRTHAEWSALTPEQRLQAALDAQGATAEDMPQEVRERVCEMYREHQTP